jgi:hypothetical protein
MSHLQLVTDEVMRDEVIDDSDPFEEMSFRGPIVITSGGAPTYERKVLSTPCEICSAETTQDPLGPNLALQGVLYQPVCDACGKSHAPELMALVKLGRAAWQYETYDPETEANPEKYLTEAASAFVCSYRF